MPCHTAQFQSQTRPRLQMKGLPATDYSVWSGHPQQQTTASGLIELDTIRPLNSVLPRRATAPCWRSRAKKRDSHQKHKTCILIKEEYTTAKSHLPTEEVKLKTEETLLLNKKPREISSKSWNGRGSSGAKPKSTVITNLRKC